jgi:hypothetical protein
MIDFQKHFNRLNAALSAKNNSSGKNCTDEIDEELWRDEVMKAINEISLESANELQQETGKSYPMCSIEYLKDSNGNIIFLPNGRIRNILKRLLRGY